MGIRDREERSPEDRWIKALQEVAPSTRVSYKREFSEFLQYVKETPSTIVKYWTEIMGDPSRNLGLSDAVNDYLDELDDQGFTGGKQDGAVRAVKKFFRVNGFTPVINTKQRARNQGVRVCTKDEVKRLLAYSVMSPRNQAIVAISKDSGLRVSDIVRVQLKHIQPLIDDPELQWLIFKLPVLKTRRQGKIALPCLGPDATRYIRLWLKDRVERGFSNDDPEAHLFVNVRGTQAYMSSDDGLRGASVAGGPMRDRAASVEICDLCKRAGLPELSANSLRKFQTTRLSVAGVDSDKIKYIQGKHQGSSTEHYLSFEAGEILPIYQAAYHELSLEGDGERELEALKAREVTRDEEFEKLRARLEAVERGFTLAEHEGYLAEGTTSATLIAEAEKKRPKN